MLFKNNMELLNCGDDNPYINNLQELLNFK